jgi:nucleotide-binding universal stress UspA family protein
VALNVQPAMPPSGINPREAIRDHHERMSAEVFQKVVVVAKREKVRVEQEMVVGMPAEAIVQQAIHHRAIEIVMGARGLGAVKGLFMGTVAMMGWRTGRCYRALWSSSVYDDISESRALRPWRQHGSAS